MVNDAVLADVPAAALYGILALRSAVFVVEQNCVFLDLDGRDLETSCRQLWLANHDGTVVATARVLDDGDERVIGRIVTAPAARGQGLAAALIDHAVATSIGPWRMEAQSRLVPYYRRFGFEPAGAPYVEDGIEHTTMRRPA